MALRAHENFQSEGLIIKPNPVKLDLVDTYGNTQYCPEPKFYSLQTIFCMKKSDKVEAK